MWVSISAAVLPLTPYCVHERRYEGRDAPVSGTSVGRMTRRICSIDWRSGDRPPCIVKIFSSMMAAMGRQLKQSVNVFHSLMLYRRLPGGDDHPENGPRRRR